MDGLNFVILILILLPSIVGVMYFNCSSEDKEMLAFVLYLMSCLNWLCYVAVIYFKIRQEVQVREDVCYIGEIQL